MIAEETKERTLQELSNALMQRDFYHKCRAMALSAKLLDTDYASDFLIRVNDLEDIKPTIKRSTNALAISSMLLSCRRTLVTTIDALPPFVVNSAVICSIARRSSHFSGTNSTCRQSKRLNKTAWLAKARQSMTVDPKLSWYLCIAFRKSIGLPYPSQGAEPQLVADKVALTKSEDLHSTE